MSNRSQTLFSHRGCGGPAVLDLSASLKMISPAFEVRSGGIAGIVVDIQNSSPTVLPLWECQKCRAQISSREVQEQLVASCMICGESHKVADLMTHERVSCVCKNCVDTLFGRRSRKLHRRVELLDDYEKMMSLTKSEHLFVPLFDVISKPISL